GPSVARRRPADASSARKAHSDSPVAGSALNRRARHQDSKIRKSLPYASCVALALLALANWAASSSVAVSSAGSAGCSTTVSAVQSMWCPPEEPLSAVANNRGPLYIVHTLLAITWQRKKANPSAHFPLPPRLQP